MTSYLKIYTLRDWCVADNYAVDGIATYLAGLTPVYEDASFQYIRPALNTSIKIALPEGRTINFTSHGGYVSIDENSETFYYYIMNVRYVAPRTVELELGLDTINTYWKDIKKQLTENDRHLIHRQHKDRFIDDTGARIIDRYPEDFQPALFPTGNVTKITNDKDNTDRTWYLVYKTRNTADNAQITCNAYCNPPAFVRGSQMAPTTTWIFDQLADDTYYYLFGSIACPNPAVRMNGTTYRVGTDDIVLLRFHRENNRIILEDIDSLGIGQGHQADTITFTTSAEYYSGPGPFIQISEIQQLQKTTLHSGTITNAYIQNLDGVDRTDPLLTKIIELPYAPFTPEFEEGLIQIPTGWQYDIVTQSLRLQSLYTEFADVIQSEDIIIPLRNAVKQSSFTPNANEPRKGWMYESKLYNSQFYDLRFLYDATSWEWKPEFFEWFDTERVSPQLRITYKPSNGINSTNAFKFEMWGGDTYRDNADYPGVFVVSRDNQQPIYNSEYLNYLKYGKEYETNEANRANARTWINAGLGIAGGIASGYLMGRGVGAVVGGIIGGITSIANSIMSTASQIHSLQQKEIEMQHQAMSITGNNDLDIFRWYNGNRLCWNIYEPTDQMRGMLYNYFYYFGYADNTYSAIDVDSRIWWNFIQADIIFVDQDMQQEFIEDIKARFRLGVTVMHKTANGYDWARDRENWEAKLFA